ncbi:hypothetical protein L2E82_13280 [Cichorium intybus]|uniref:Uncharacterized protein n=1 Tax=Cichorium intybus TaxID=13427 RepID=A0ACB9GJL5_CICIN|nr:hypothetical protein L2E82_13280 [Cichorium intybus]
MCVCMFESDCIVFDSENSIICLYKTPYEIAKRRTFYYKITQIPRSTLRILLRLFPVACGTTDRDGTHLIAAFRLLVRLPSPAIVGPPSISDFLVRLHLRQLCNRSEKMNMDITEFLKPFRLSDAKIYETSAQQLTQLQKENLAGLLLSLSQELSDDGKPPESRASAGIVLNKSLDASAWMSIDISTRLQIKDLLLNTLGSSISEAGQTAALVIGKIASVEIPIKAWPQLLGCLLQNMTEQGSSNLKKATLESLGCICEGVSYDGLDQVEAKSVLVAVVEGMDATQHKSVRVAAAAALIKALEFAQTLFKDNTDRDYIMKMLCETALATEAEIRKAAFECLVSVASTYYDYMEPHMSTLFELTEKAFKDEENIALQAVGFWSCICDEEIRLTGDSYPHFRFIETSKCRLVPMLLETLSKKDGNDIWDLLMAVGTCLGLIARIIGDSIVQLVIFFVDEKLSKEDGVSRAVGAYVLGTILEGPSAERMSARVSTVLPSLLTAWKDENSHVKSTIVWTLSRILEVLHKPATSFAISSDHLGRIIKFLLECLKSSDVAYMVCGAIYDFAKGYEDFKGESSMLTHCLADITTSLIATAETTDVQLQSAAYETLSAVVRHSDLSKTSQIIKDLHRKMISKLSQISSEDIEKQGDLRALLCGVLQVIIRKLGSMEETKSFILQAADKIMPLLIKVFKCESSTEHKETMLATGALAYAIGSKFEDYMPQFDKYLKMGLQNYDNHQVRIISVGVVGDICRALGDKMFSYCDDIMELLFENLSRNDSHPVKPPIFSCFGDMALAVGKNFGRHVDRAMLMMQEGVKLCGEINVDDEEMLEYGNQLKRSIFEAYSAILQVLKNSKADLTLYSPQLLKFIEVVVKDADRDESLGKAAVELLGDLANALGPHISVFNRKMSK